MNVHYVEVVFYGLRNLKINQPYIKQQDEAERTKKELQFYQDLQQLKC